MSVKKCSEAISLVLIGSAITVTAVGCSQREQESDMVVTKAKCEAPPQGQGDWGGPEGEEKQPGQACYNSTYQGNRARGGGFIPIPIPIGGRGRSRAGGSAPTSTSAPARSASSTPRGGFGSSGHSFGAHS
ncbi:MAG: hypothetical protein ABI353_05040 [Isosphaeraceae bacterium]